MDTRTSSHAAEHPPERRKPRRGAGILLLAALILIGGIWLQDALTYDGPREAVFPLPLQEAEYTNDWGAPRPQGPHEGTDIYAPEGTPIYAITGGTVTGSGWNTLGGYTVMVRAAYGIGPVERGDLLYYAHLREPSPLEPGDEVVAGQKIGEAGRTAGEEEGTVAGFPPHLHLGWYEGFSLFGESRAQAESGAMNPYPLLRWIESGGGRVTPE
ncbi:M23 family metallopeptidase [Rubrobacter taiwanensis]|jgi:murein DD-endopeptidase MepM/ murein hydrolase activator NlpD|uniref:M23 family metallopeptidase n=1 Tax=Rubrobacter taiwanensis TaxID=185139 RepID=A0A4R1BTK5_9ACTN|nr:M23 family metallopeptidase [Rubrobacter taiwanensis]TCJ20777.1 M23 family metallopeptidase [Rubrobacter taiwanensis]